MVATNIWHANQKIPVCEPAVERWTHRKRHVDIVSRFSFKASYPVLLTTDGTASLANGSLIVLHVVFIPLQPVLRVMIQRICSKT